MSIRYKDVSAIKNALPRYKQAGTWRTVAQAYHKVAGVWRAIFELTTGWTLEPFTTPVVFTGNEYFLGYNCTSVVFKPDGTKAFILDASTNQVHQYTASTPRDITTLTEGAAYDITETTYPPYMLRFNDTGTKIFILFTTNVSGFPAIFEYDLTTAWDTSTAVFVTSVDITSVAPVAENCQAMDFKPDGTKLWVGQSSSKDSAGGEIYEFDLSTPWDISTISYSSVSYDLDPLTPPNVDANIASMNFSPDGTKLYAIFFENDNLVLFTASTPWDITTLTLDPDQVVFSEDAAPYDVDFNSDYSSMIMCGIIGDSLYEYTFPTPGRFGNTQDIYTGKSLDTTSQDSRMVSMFFKPDGTKLVTVAGGSSANQGIAYQYSLSTPWDLATSVYENSISIPEPNDVENVRLSPNGDKMYVLEIGVSSPQLFQYSLTTPWDIQTRAYDSVVFSDIGVQAFAFKPDGTKLFVINYNDNNKVLSYTLSTPWDLSTATTDNNSSPVFEPETVDVDSLLFSPDGSVLIMGSSTMAIVTQYNLSTPWDVSTMTRQNYEYSFGLLVQLAEDFYISDDGINLYVFGSGVNDPRIIYQCSLQPQ